MSACVDVLPVLGSLKEGLSTLLSVVVLQHVNKAELGHASPKL